LAIAWLFAAFVAVLVNSVLIYTTIRHQERRNERYTLPVDTAHTPNAIGGSSSGSPHDWALGTVAQRPSSTCTPSSQAPQDANEAESHSVGQTVTEDRTSESDSDSSDWTRHDRNCTSILAASQDQAYIAEFDFDNDTASRNNESNTAGTMIPVAAEVVVSAASSSNPAHKVKTSRVAAQQSTLCCCATLLPTIVLVIPWLGTTLFVVTQQCQLVFASLLQYLLATQGIFYLFIYIRPAYRRLPQRMPDASHIHCLVLCLFSNDPKHW
jgi:hypothetical protein